MSDSELEALKKDAERYRFLKRKAKPNDYCGMFQVNISTLEVDVDTKLRFKYTDHRNSFDDAVDAEMRREKK